MLDGEPLFPGKNHVDQFLIITELLGTPTDDVINTITSENVHTVHIPSPGYLLILNNRHCDSLGRYPSESVSH
jgi:hypothetical protein